MLEVSQGIGLKDLVEAFYFRPDQIGGLEAMTPGLIDFESAFFIKATAYQVRVCIEQLYSMDGKEDLKIFPRVSHLYSAKEPSSIYDVCQDVFERCKI